MLMHSSSWPRKQVGQTCTKNWSRGTALGVESCTDACLPHGSQVTPRQRAACVSYLVHRPVSCPWPVWGMPPSASTHCDVVMDCLLPCRAKEAMTRSALHRSKAECLSLRQETMRQGSTIVKLQAQAAGLHEQLRCAMSGCCDCHVAPLL